MLSRIAAKQQQKDVDLLMQIILITRRNSLKHVKKKDQKKLIFVALEDVTDPRNIGSIIRSAVSFNIDGLIIKKRSFPSSSKLMYKSSSGSIEHFNIFRVSNTNTALKYLKSKGFWICGFDSKSNNDFTKHDWNDNYVLLFGSEGYGLKYQTSKKTDFLFKIDINIVTVRSNL